MAGLRAVIAAIGKNVRLSNLAHLDVVPANPIIHQLILDRRIVSTNDEESKALPDPLSQLSLTGQIFRQTDQPGAKDHDQSQWKVYKVSEAF